MRQILYTSVFCLTFLACMDLSQAENFWTRLFKRKNNKENEILSEVEVEVPKEDLVQPSNKFQEIFGEDVSFIELALGAACLLVGLKLFQSSDKSKDSSENKNDDVVDVVVVGMGLPKRGMGWYHLTQLLEHPDLKSLVRVIGVVEPFFLNDELCKDVPQVFTDYVKATESDVTKFVKSFDELPEFGEKTLCLIAGRTGDNPRFFSECVQKGAKYIYLEKPGAPTVKELEEMKALADEKGVKVRILKTALSNFV